MTESLAAFRQTSLPADLNRRKAAMSDPAEAALAFKDARETLGLSVRDLAYVLGTREDTIRKWEDPKGFGPNPVAVEAVRWILEEGFTPAKLAEVRQAQG